MDINPIHNDEEYTKALETLEQLLPDFFMESDDSETYKHFETLSTLIEAYERSKWPSRFPDPIDALCFHIKQRDLDLKDLEKIIGSPLTTKRVLRREEPLTIPMIWKICKAWKIPVESLTQPCCIKETKQARKKHTVH